MREVTACDNTAPTMGEGRRTRYMESGRKKEIGTDVVMQEQTVPEYYN